MKRMLCQGPIRRFGKDMTHVLFHTFNGKRFSCPRHASDHGMRFGPEFLGKVERVMNAVAKQGLSLGLC